MTRLLCAALMAMLCIAPASAERVHGFSARYATDAKMARAAALHRVEVPATRKMCASPFHPLGTLLTVTSRVRGRAGRTWRCVVVDVAHERDRATIIRRGIVIELPPSGAMHICGSVTEPPRQCVVSVERG